MKARPLKKRGSLEIPEGWRLLERGEIVPVGAKFKLKGIYGIGYEWTSGFVGHVRVSPTIEYIVKIP